MIQPYDKIAVESIIPHINGDIEMAIGIDTDGNVIFKQGGTPTSVFFTDRQIQLLRGNFVIHNHLAMPKTFGRGLSEQDIRFTVHNKIAGIGVVTMYNGCIEYYKATTNEFSSLISGNMPMNLSVLKDKMYDLVDTDRLEELYKVSKEYITRLSHLLGCNYKSFVFKDGKLTEMFV